MEKNSKKNVVCTHCTAMAIPGTYPPVCAEHQNLQKTANDKPDTLKTLETTGLDW